MSAFIMSLLIAEKKPFVYISYIILYQSNLLVDLKALLHCHQYTWIWIKCKNNIDYHNSLVSMGWSTYVCFYNVVSLLLEQNLCIYFEYQPNLLIDLKALLHCHQYTWIWIKCKNNIEYHKSLVSMGCSPYVCFFNALLIAEKKPLYIYNIFF